jgi:SAM-dependent methyltransferase
VAARRYCFGEDDELEAGRLSALERAFDPLTRAVLAELGVCAGWRCWEVGAGRGGVARWLARAVGPSGAVLASDIEERSCGEDDGVTFLRHDVTSDPLPDVLFDLIHARFLLEHLDEPAPTIQRLTRALRPGGLLVLADSSGLEITAVPSCRALEGLAEAWERAGRRAGWEPTYGRRLMTDLRAAGLAGVEGREHRRLAPGAAGWEHLRVGLERLRGELAEEGVGERELDAALACLDDRARLLTGPSVTIAWGRSV